MAGTKEKEIQYRPMHANSVNRNSGNQETGIQKQEMGCCKTTDFAATHSLIFSFSVWSRERFQLQLSLLHQAVPTARFEPYLR